MERWIGDYALASRRPLEEEEIAALRAELRQARLFALLAWSLAIAGFLVAWLPGFDYRLAPLTLIGLFVVITMFPVGLTFTSKSRRLRRTLETPFVETYVHEDEELTVLPGGKAIVDESLKPLRPVIVREVHQPGKSAGPMFPRELRESPIGLAETRSLTLGEISELQAIVNRLSVSNGVILASLATAVPTIWLVDAGGHSKERWLEWLMSAIATPFVCWLWHRVGRLYVLRRRLAEDSRVGTVFKTQAFGAPGVIEVLPRSGMIWTFDDLPSDWRKRA
ncbi:MAG TPA: hypothetical protein VHE55_11445 [Fimbriimonadaceae bacterium]|nr:hypothetical protein [Fimbriimonadaceae bacterium]